MYEKKTDVGWSWNYNHGELFPWPCSKCGSLVKIEKIGNPNQTMYARCPKCRGINAMEDFGCIHNVMHEKCTKCGYIQEMSLDRCLK